MLEILEIPDYQTLKTQNRPLPLILPLVKPQQIIREKSSTLEEDFSGSEESFAEEFSAQASSASEISEDELDDNLQIADEFVSFEYSGVTRTSLGALFKVQGLNVFLNNSGEMLVEGSQTDFSKPIFLSCQKSIVLNNVDASTVKLIAPTILGVGSSNIDFLSLEGLTETAVFINSGSLTAKELFLKNLKSSNTGSIIGTSFAIDGKLESTGTITSDELTLEENACLKLVEGSQTDIETLFLSKSSHFENHAKTDELHLDVLTGVGGTVTNYGALVMDAVDKHSKFEAIVNHNLMSAVTGDLNTRHLSNSGVLDFASGIVAIEEGENLSLIKARQLQVASSFANNAEGYIETSMVAGSGAIVNQGRIETYKDLAFDVQKFTNQKGGLVKAKSIAGLANLQKFTNDEDSGVDAGESLSFANTTEVINQGHMQAKAMTLVVAKTAQSGDIKAQSLKLTCGGSFENLGDIDVEQELSLALTKLINRGSLKVAAVTVGARLTSLENAKGALIEVKDSTLAFVKTEVVNDGTLKGGSYSFSGGSLAQSGVIDGKSLKLDDVVVTTTDSQTINLSGNLEQSSAGSWSIRGTINAYRYTRFGDIDLHGTLNLKPQFWIRSEYLRELEGSFS